MEPYEINLSLVVGTAGTFAVGYSPAREDWLVCRLRRRPSDHPDWLWVDSATTEDAARKIAYALYAQDMARRAMR
jgi:hypothetical protein